MTGSGNVGGSSRIGWSSSQSVSPVVMFLIPTIAPRVANDHPPVVFQRQTADDRDKFIRDRLPANGRFQNLRRDRFLFENNFRDLVIEIGNLLDQTFISLVDSGNVFLRDVRD